MRYRYIDSNGFIQISTEQPTEYEFTTIPDEDLSQSIEAQKLQELQEFLYRKKKDGEEYYNDVELRLTLLLAGLPLNELIVVNQEIEIIIKPLMNEIAKGDWFNVYMRTEITNQTAAPTTNSLKPFYKEIKERVKEYFENNYPREEIQQTQSTLGKILNFFENILK